MDQLVLYIAEKAGIRELRTSTRRISMDINASQQTISRKLRELETQGLLYRSSTPGGVTVRLTNIAISALQNAYNSLRNLFESTNQLGGHVSPGMGEGGYYVKIYTRKFKEKLGFEPFPGTLNLDVDPLGKNAFVLGLRQIEIPEFKTPSRTFGAVYCYKIRINHKISGALIIPVRARHADNIIELLAPVDLRQSLKLKDGSRLTISRG